MPSGRRWACRPKALPEGGALTSCRAGGQSGGRVCVCVWGSGGQAGWGCEQGMRRGDRTRGATEGVRIGRETGQSQTQWREGLWPSRGWPRRATTAGAHNHIMRALGSRRSTVVGGGSRANGKACSSALRRRARNDFHLCSNYFQSSCIHEAYALHASCPHPRLRRR